MFVIEELKGFSARQNWHVFFLISRYMVHDRHHFWEKQVKRRLVFVPVTRAGVRKCVGIDVEYMTQWGIILANPNSVGYCCSQREMRLV